MTTTANSLIDDLLKQSEDLLPGDFYDVRQEVAPKAAWAPMYALAAAAYVAAIIAFVCLFITESKKTITDTVITPYDNTGQDGYTCQMISKVTASFQISSESGKDPSQEYNLVNIIESKSQFEQDIAAADPCSLPLTYFPTEDVRSGSFDATYGAMTMRGENMAYVFNTHTEEIVSYNYSVGTQSSLPVDFSPIMTSLAVDHDGYAIFLHPGDEETKVVYRKDVIENHEAEAIYSFELATTPLVLNDNLYNIYLVQNNTFTALDVYSDYTATNTTLFTLTDAQYIVHAVVYNSGSSIKVYYLNQINVLYAWENGVTTFLDAYPQTVLGLAVDGADNLYTLTSDIPGVYYVEDINQSPMSSYDSLSPPGGFAISPSGKRIFLAMSTTAGIQDLAFIYDVADGPSIGDGEYREPEVISQVSGFGAGWFTCGAEVLNATDYTPGVREEYPYQCIKNGVVGQVLYNEDYFFTPTDTKSYAISMATGHCTTLYAPIAGTISDLPPYSCTRTTHPGFFVCLATAVANTQLLFQIIVFFSAMLLTKLSKRYPPQRTHAPPAVRVKEEIEMASMPERVVKNPMA